MWLDVTVDTGSEVESEETSVSSCILIRAQIFNLTNEQKIVSISLI
jgi:hypothetical protein